MTGNDLGKGECKADLNGKVPVCLAKQFGHCPLVENIWRFLSSDLMHLVKIVHRGGKSVA